MSQPTDQQLDDAFRLFDKDGDGILNTEELMVVMRSMNLKPDEQQARPPATPPRGPPAQAARVPGDAHGRSGLCVRAQIRFLIGEGVDGQFTARGRGMNLALFKDFMVRGATRCPLLSSRARPSRRC